ncbi:hypothetical protein TrLO_g10965 [Triparma laevis f. longispina]|uniref:Uncharacterized protein n=1 Tax=Triparma laevis f. longispina TaxID=1714387 RepID=A0A9W7AK33_9STRA|nr:hypothetical protein TrLO_g10965 [Triparma laevis f. longispina]
MKACEIAFESIPESIIQVGGLLKQNYGDIKTIQVIGVISSIGAGAFIMTDGNFGFILSKYLQVPNDPYYRWISKIGGWEKKRQMFGMFLINACYFSQFVFAMSLFENSAKFIKRFATIYAYHGNDEEEVDEALVKLLGRSGADLERGVEGQLTFIQSSKSKSRIKQTKIEPSPN